MGSKFNLLQLEAAFSNDFTSYVYVLLADEYLNNHDLGRAYTVAKIGQENHPNDIFGKYVLAKIYLLKNNIQKARKLLEEVLEIFPLHINARKLLIEIFKKQNNNEKLDYHIIELQKYLPNEASIKSSSEASSLVNGGQSNEMDKEVAQNKSHKKEKVNMSINNNMATFTFVDILISQKHYENALEVLSVLEKKGRSKDRINQKRQEINKILENA